MSWFLTIRNFKLLEPYERKLSRTVLRGESSRKGTDLPGKVREIILMVGDVSDIYVTNFGKMMNDENFSSRELDAIAFGYTKLLEESNGVLQDLKQVINVSTLSMTDKDRMDVVDECYRNMHRYRNLVNYYTNRNIAVSYLRAKKKNDMDRVLKLYGSETSKYW